MTILRIYICNMGRHVLNNIEIFEGEAYHYSISVGQCRGMAAIRPKHWPWSASQGGPRRENGSIWVISRGPRALLNRMPDRALCQLSVSVYCEIPRVTARHTHYCYPPPPYNFSLFRNHFYDLHTANHQVKQLYFGLNNRWVIDDIVLP